MSHLVHGRLASTWRKLDEKAVVRLKEPLQKGHRPQDDGEVQGIVDMDLGDLETEHSDFFTKALGLASSFVEGAVTLG